MPKSPFTIAYRNTVAVGFTNKQYEVLRAYCKENHTSMSAAVRDAFLQLHGIKDKE